MLKLCLFWPSSLFGKCFFFNWLILDVRFLPKCKQVSVSRARGSSLRAFRGSGGLPEPWADEFLTRVNREGRVGCMLFSRSLSRLQASTGRENFQNSLGTFKTIRMFYINNKMCFFRRIGFLEFRVLFTQKCIHYL